MKKITLATLIILNLALLSACGKQATDTTNPPVSPDTNAVSDGTTPPADTTTPSADITAQQDTAKKPQIPSQTAPADNTKTNVDAEVKSILHDITKQENTPPADTTDTTNQPTADVSADSGTTAATQQ